MNTPVKINKIVFYLLILAGCEALLTLVYLSFGLPMMETGRLSMARLISITVMGVTAFGCLFMAIWMRRKLRSNETFFVNLLNRKQFRYSLLAGLSILFFSLGVLIPKFPYYSLRPILTWLTLICVQTIVGIHFSFIKINDGELTKHENLTIGYSPNHSRLGFIAMILFGLMVISIWIYFQFHLAANIPFIFQDPEYHYLGSSLSVFKGSPYIYIDHPGTPIELLGSFFFLITYFFIPQQFFEFHLSNPQVFLTLARGFLTLLTIVCFCLIVRKTERGNHWTDGIVSIGIAGLFFALHPDSFKTLVMWSHNSFNYSLGTLLLLCLYCLLRSGNELKIWQIKAIGFCVGVLTAFQIYFATWVVSTILAVGIFYLLEQKNWVKIFSACLVTAAGSILGFGVATFPILDRYPEFLNWIFKVSFNQGIYGTGIPGFTSLQQFTTNFVTLWNSLPQLFLGTGVLFISIVVLMVFQRKNIKAQRGLWAIAIGIMGQIILLYVIIIKHPNQVYMLAVAAALPILLATLYDLFENYSVSSQGLVVLKRQEFNPHKINKLIKIIIGFLITFGVIYNLFQFINLYQNRVDLIHQEQSQIEQVVSNYANIKKAGISSIKVLWTYGTSSSCRALWFGNRYGNSVFSEEISKICPNQFDLILPEKLVTTIRGEIPLDKFNWDIIIIRRQVLDENPSLLEFGDIQDTQIMDDNSPWDLIFIIYSPSSIDQLSIK